MPNWNNLSYEIENTPYNSLLIQNLESLEIVENDLEKDIYVVRTLGLQSVIFNLEDYIDNQIFSRVLLDFFKRKIFQKILELLLRIVKILGLKKRKIFLLK